MVRGEGTGGEPATDRYRILRTEAKNQGIVSPWYLTPGGFIRHYNCGPAATSCLPSSVSVYFAKLSIKRFARSFAFSFHISACS